MPVCIQSANWRVGSQQFTTSVSIYAKPSSAVNQDNEASHCRRSLGSFSTFSAGHSYTLAGAHQKTFPKIHTSDTSLYAFCFPPKVGKTQLEFHTHLFIRLKLNTFAFRLYFKVNPANRWCQAQFGVSYTSHPNLTGPPSLSHLLVRHLTTCKGLPSGLW